MKDKNLRKILWGFWHTQDRDIGGPNIVIDQDLLTKKGKWEIPLSEGIIRFLLNRIDGLEGEINKLKIKK